MASRIYRAFVIGSPINHSLSPDLHSFWLEQYAIRGSYEKILVLPADLGEFLSNMISANFVGGNITLPHKETAYQKLGNCDDTANQLEAVNTVWIEDQKIVAGNTDAYGFGANLDDFAPAWRKAKTAMVLGAGGAAKSIILALINAGYEKIFIANRTHSRSQALALKMGHQCISIQHDETSETLKNVDLLINTTSLGMKNQANLDINLSNLSSSAIVTDIVYNPIKTSLLKNAQARGLETVDGIGMLLHQAVPGFEKWFGVRPQVTSELRNHMLNILREDI